MKYRHQYHAGNFADVHKHVLLLEVLAALARKDKGLLFVDTHAGRGDYDLHPGDAAHPAEWQSGVAKLLAATPRHAALARYRELVAAGVHGGKPAVSRVAAARGARAARRGPRGVLRNAARRGGAAAQAARESTACARRGRRWFRRPARAAAATRATRLRPDRSAVRRTRGFHASARCREADALQRFENAVLVLWLPVKMRADFDALAARPCAPPRRGRCSHRCCGCTRRDSRAALNGSALVLVNPPYLVEEAHARMAARAARD